MASEHNIKIKIDLENLEKAIRLLTAEEFPQKGACVHCKDCRHWDRDTDAAFANASVCRKLSTYGAVLMGADDYCSRGERREDD